MADENGQICRVAGADSDISKRKEIEYAGVDAEAHARRAQDRLADAINVSADGFAVFNPCSMLEKANDKVSGALGGDFVGIHTGIHSAELIATLAEAIMLENEDETSSNSFDRQMAYHASPEGSVVIQTSAERWYNLTERKTNDDGTVLMLSDVTAMKLAEQDLKNRVLDLQTAKLVSDQQSETSFNHLPNSLPRRKKRPTLPAARKVSFWQI